MYRKKPVIVEATQWFKNGDHPLDGTDRHVGGCHAGKLKEGKIVRYSHFSFIDGYITCNRCGNPQKNHGSMKLVNGWLLVCPGDWIITGVNGEFYPCKPYIFDQTYEKVEVES